MTFEEIKAQMWQQERQVRDENDVRYVCCEQCGAVKPADDFKEYGGEGRINLGICFDCARSARLKFGKSN